MPHSRIGPLAIETQLGSDRASSSVWRALHVKHRKSLAIRIYPIPFGGTPEAKQRFIDEWEVLKSLQHPAITKCYGGGIEGTDAYLAHELIDGESLTDQLSRAGRMSWEAVLDIAEPIASALEYLHGKGIVHGSVQPDKIMIAGLSPILLDVRQDRFQTPFRVSRPVTAEQMAMGAPELVNNPQAVSVATDLYALGAVMYLAITGHRPIDGATAEEVRGNLAFQTPVSPASLVLDCPVWMDKLVLQLLNKNPAARPPSATAVVAALAEVRRRAMSRTGVAEHVSSGFSPLQVTDQKQRDEARSLLGREVVSVAEESADADEGGWIEWHDQPWVLIGGLFLCLAFLAWVAWPASVSHLRGKAEGYLATETRNGLRNAKTPLRQIIKKYPGTEDAQWARDQLDHIDVVLFLHQLSFKIKTNSPIKSQGESLHKQAQDFANIGDTSEAIDKYRSIITILGDDPEYRIVVNAAKYQLAQLEKDRQGDSEASQIIRSKLAEADKLMEENKVVQAKEIWYSLVELYKNNSEVKSLIEIAQEKLAEN